MQNTLLNLTPGAYSPEVHLSQYEKGVLTEDDLAEINAKIDEKNAPVESEE